MATTVHLLFVTAVTGDLLHTEECGESMQDKMASPARDLTAIVVMATEMPLRDNKGQGIGDTHHQ